MKTSVLGQEKSFLLLDEPSLQGVKDVLVLLVMENELGYNLVHMNFQNGSINFCTILNWVN